MPTSQQRLKSIYFQNLKNLKDVDISLEESPVTVLMGANGCGKTTVLRKRPAKSPSELQH